MKTISEIKHTALLRITCFSLAAAAICLGAWYEESAIGIAFLFPIIWSLAQSRKEAFACSVSYYFTGLATLPESAGVFFESSDYSWNFGILLLLVSGLILATPWTLLWTKETNPHRKTVRLASILLLVSIPPVGLIGLCNPLLSAAQLFPGLGLLSLVSIAAGWTCFIYIQGPTSITRRVMLASAVVLAAASVLSIASFNPKKAPPGWVAINTHFGKYPDDLPGRVQRQLDLIALAKASISSKEKPALVVFPEQVGGWFPDAYQEIWAREFRYFSNDKDRPTMVLVGVSRPTGVSEVYKNAISLWFDGELLGYVSARQAVPVAMWRPWSTSGARTQADWFKTNIIAVPTSDGKIKNMVTLFCYEELLPWVMISTLASSSPDGIISVVNAWWADPAARRIQRNHALAWSRIFNLPLVRAVNG